MISVYQVLFVQSSAVLDSPSLKMSVFFPPGIRRADLTWEFHLLLSERKEEVRVSCLLLLFLSILSVQLLRHV